MQWGSSKQTALYFFSSVRADSGKSTIVSNLSIYLNSLNYKVAIIDLDYLESKKLRQSFPESCDIQEYSELSDLIKSEAPRFQQNFHLSNTNRLSLFNAQKIKFPNTLFTDIAFKDFLILLSNTFDYLFINLANGTNQSENVSNLLTKSYLFNGYKPSSIIISLSDEKSLVELDRFIQNNPIINYQSEENTYFVFNKVPQSNETQESDEPSLNSIELRSVFAYPLVYVIPFIDEIIEQSNNVNPFVLQNDTVINQHIKGLTKILNGYASISYMMYESGSYQSCISGNLLNQIYPYIEQIQKSIAHRLFINPSDVNIYVEQSEQNFRLRVRLTSLGQKLLGIRSNIPDYQKLSITNPKESISFNFGTLKDKFKATNHISRDTSYTLSFKSIYSFDDNFYYEPVKKINKKLQICLSKQTCPSPILFDYKSNISEIPTLSNILGLDKSNKLVKYYDSIEKISLQEVNPVYIPLDFPVTIKLRTITNLKFIPTNSFILPTITMPIHMVLNKLCEYCIKRTEPYRLFDNFTTYYDFEYLSDFSIKYSRLSYYFELNSSFPIGKFSLYNEKIIDSNNKFLDYQQPKVVISENSISKFKLSSIKELKFNFSLTWLNNLHKYIVDTPKQFKLIALKNDLCDFLIRKYSLALCFSIPKLTIKAEIYNLSKLEKKQIDLNINPFIKGLLRFNYSNKFEISTKEQLLIRGFKQLPQSFSLEDLLMEYSYYINISKGRNEKYLFNTKLSKKLEFTPQIRYKFFNNYMEPETTMKTTYKKPVMYQLFKLGKLRVSKKVIVSSVDYKVIFNDIFKSTEITRNNETIKEKEIVLPKYLELKDITNNNRNLFRLKIRNFYTDNKNDSNNKLLIVSPIPREIDLFKVNYTLDKIASRITSFNKIDKINNIINNFNLKLSLFNIFIFSLKNKIELKDDSIINFNLTFNSEIEPPIIYTENIRVKSEKFFSYKIKNTLMNINPSKTVLTNSFEFKTQDFVHHKLLSKINDSNKKRNEVLVPRTRSIKLQNNFTNLKEYNPKYYDFTYKLKDQILSFYKEEMISNKNYSNKKEFKLDNSVIDPVKKYILKITALKRPTVKSFKRGCFYIDQESNIDFLYNHFIWLSKNAYGPITYDYNKELTEKKSIKFKKTFKNCFILNTIYSNKYRFRFNRNHLIRINTTFIRKPYKVEYKVNVNDLLSRAKALMNQIKTTSSQINISNGN